MSTVSAVQPAKPMLLFFHSPTSGPCRRVEGYLAQVLQRRANHDTFAIHFVDAEERKDLAVRLLVDRLPTLLIAENRRVRGRLVAPHGCRAIEEFLGPWLH